MLVFYAIVSVVLCYWNFVGHTSFWLQVVLPACFAIMTFCAGLYSKKHRSNRRLWWHIYLLMVLSIAYMSAFSVPLLHAGSTAGLFVLIGFSVVRGERLPIALYICLVPYMLGLARVLPLEWVLLPVMLVPLVYVFTGWLSQLLGETLQFEKVRYYGYLSMGTALVLSVMMVPFVGDWQQIVLCFLLFSTVLHVLLYVKEQLDFRARRRIVTPSDDRSQHLVQIVHRLSLCTSQQELYTLVEEELRFYKARVVRGAGTFMLAPGVKLDVAKEGLTRDEVVWLELLVSYVAAFAQSVARMEELIAQLEAQSSPVLHKLLLQLLEQEKNSIARELHDTVLQEVLHVARVVDDEAQREILLEAAFELREYCEHLHPPLLETHGFKEAADKLVQKTKLRADFLLDARIEAVEFNEPLFLYRIMQELLTNAMKHAEASRVELVVQETARGVELMYCDDGIGLTNAVPSMGLRGLQERVKATGGELTIEAQPYRVHIEWRHDA